MTESPKRLIDVTDPRFSLPENDEVLAFIARTSPFAHGDVGSLLFDVARELPGAQAYCPAPRQFAYVVLHSATSLIFAIAHGQRKLAFRLTGHPRAEALADGAMLAEGIGADWLYVEPWPNGVATPDNSARLRRLAELALSQVEMSAGGTQ